MLERLKEFWQREKWFTYAMAGIVIGIYLLTPKIQFSTGTKLLFGFIFLLFLGLLLGGMSIFSAKSKEKAPDTTEKKEESLMDKLKIIIANVPENHIWVLRNVWRSNPDTYKGYWEKPEGWRIFIPWVVHDEIKLVTLVPLQREPDLIEVNTKDNLLPLVKYRIKTWVARYDVGNKPVVDNAATKYALRIEDRVDVEDQWAHVTLNRITSNYFCSKSEDGNEIGLTEMTEEDLREKLSVPATELFNEEMKHFGIQGEIAIHNIRPPKAIEAASSQVSVAKLREAAATPEAAAMKKVIDATKANPTWVLLAETLGSVARSILGAKEEKPVSEKEEKK